MKKGITVKATVVNDELPKTYKVRITDLGKGDEKKAIDIVRGMVLRTYAKRYFCVPRSMSFEIVEEKKEIIK